MRENAPRMPDRVPKTRETTKTMRRGGTRHLYNPGARGYSGGQGEKSPEPERRMVTTCIRAEKKKTVKKNGKSQPTTGQRKTLMGERVAATKVEDEKGRKPWEKRALKF